MVKVGTLDDKRSRYTLAQHPDQQLQKTHTAHSRSERPILSVYRRHSVTDRKPEFDLAGRRGQPRGNRTTEGWKVAGARLDLSWFSVCRILERR